MNWFRKSSPPKLGSQRNISCKQQLHARQKKKQQSASDSKLLLSHKRKQTASSAINGCATLSQSSPLNMKKSLSAMLPSEFEKLEPDDFFHDPEHVRNYKEEAQFLSVMSEWEIVENPSTRDINNYFSADFEDQFVQWRTQDHATTTTTTMATATSLSSTLEFNQNADGSENNANTVVDEKENEMGEQQPLSTFGSCEYDDIIYPESPPPAKRRLCSFLLFTDNIQTGIVPPRRRVTRNSLQHNKHATKKTTKKHKGTTPDTLKGNVDINEIPTSELCRADITQCPHHTDSNGSIASLKCANTTTRTFSNHVVKDCAIDRKQLKNEALARSIMGAIGKCPAKDRTNSVGNDPLISPLRDICHPTGKSGCDHYDIQQSFQLDDNGNILLNINHIREYRGFGFAVAQNERLYRRYLKGHPRNKASTNSTESDEALRAYTLKLAQDPNSTFARNIENFISCTKESREAVPQVMMRNMRQFMNGMKNYLVKHGEGKFLQEVETARARLKSDQFLNLDAILETVMHQLIVLPLREYLYGMFVDYYTRSEDIQLLAENVKYACGRSAEEFGIRASVSPPSTSSLQIISNLLLRLQEAELPLDKLEIFRCVIQTINDTSSGPYDHSLVADDFLPVLVYVVAKCGFVGAEIEAEFMWGLLQQPLLNGESGYYLTSLCSAVHVLKRFMASEKESGTGSLDWRSCSLPACSSVLRVIIPDECNGSLQTRTLPVRPHTTTREVCRIIAHKARITNPQDYALFKLVDGEETLLNDSECPQDVRLEAKGKQCMIAYKRIDAKIAWPTTQTTTAAAQSQLH